MKTRIPLWATLVPLAGGVVLWAMVWNGYEDKLIAQLQAVLPEGTAVEASGFPYRLVAGVKPLALSYQGQALKAGLTADEAQLNRVPWQTDRQVITLVKPKGELSLAPYSAATLAMEAETGLSSVRMDGTNIARVSIVWADAKMQTGLFKAPLSASKFETHLRETPSDDTNATNPRHATQLQTVIAGEAVRVGNGDPMTMRFEAEFTAAAPIKSLATWQREGTVEIKSWTLADATGEVATITGTIVPTADGLLRVNGVAQTVCPASLRAAVAGTGPISEMRARRMIEVTVSGVLGGEVIASPADPNKPAPPVRGQEPPCPKFG